VRSGGVNRGKRGLVDVQKRERDDTGAKKKERGKGVLQEK